MASSSAPSVMSPTFALPSSQAASALAAAIGATNAI